MSWQPWVTEVEIKGATGGRRGPGSANHCMHGKDAVIEEILDWRPYDYVTDRTVLATPTGPLKLLHTSSSSRPRPAPRSICDTRRPRPSETVQLARQSPTRTGTRCGRACPTSSSNWMQRSRLAKRIGGPEPELMAARPDGPLSGLAPLVMID